MQTLQPDVGVISWCQTTFSKKCYHPSIQNVSSHPLVDCLTIFLQAMTITLSFQEPSMDLSRSPQLCPVEHTDYCWHHTGHKPPRQWKLAANFSVLLSWKETLITWVSSMGLAWAKPSRTLMSSLSFPTGRSTSAFTRESLDTVTSLISLFNPGTEGPSSSSQGWLFSGAGTRLRMSQGLMVVVFWSHLSWMDSKIVFSSVLCYKKEVGFVWRKVTDKNFEASRWRNLL